MGVATKASGDERRGAVCVGQVDIGHAGSGQCVDGAEVPFSARDDKRRVSMAGPRLIGVRSAADEESHHTIATVQGGDVQRGILCVRGRDVGTARISNAPHLHARQAAPSMASWQVPNSSVD